MKLKKIGIDARSLSTPGGAKVHLTELLKNISGLSKNFEIYLFHDTDSVSYHKSEFKKILMEPSTRGLKGHFTFDQFVLPALINKYEIDLFYGQRNSIPWFSPSKTVFQMHDTKLGHTLLERKFWKILVEKSMSTSDAIICPTKFVKNKIQEQFSTPQGKIFVIPEGVRDYFSPHKSNYSEVLEKYGIRKPYLLYVGKISPHRKNHDTLIKAFNQLLERNNHLEYDLVLVGPPGIDYKNVLRLADKSKHSDNIFFTGTISDEDLSCLYSEATLYVHPCLYDGFGLPPLEAMACGTPVIASNTSSIPEVIGNAGAMTNPEDSKELAKEMRRLLENRKLRKKLTKKGLKRAEKFSWEKTAKKTIEVCKEVLSE